jgi:hypothetical protein
MGVGATIDSCIHIVPNFKFIRLVRACSTHKKWLSICVEKRRADNINHKLYNELSIYTVVEQQKCHTDCLW